LSGACEKSGRRVGQPIDLNTNCDLLSEAGRQAAWKIIVGQAPTYIFLAPPCTPWSQMQNINNRQEVYRKQLEALPILNFCLVVAKYQSENERFLFFENPSTSKIWNTKQFTAILNLSNATCADTDFGMFGMQDPVSQRSYRKRVSLMHNMPPEAVARLFRLCHAESRRHEHEPIEGNCPGYGSRTRLSQVYPTSFCRIYAECLMYHHQHIR
jgi:hypothetical protein